MVVQHPFSCLSSAWNLHVSLFSRKLCGPLHVSGLVHGASWGSIEPFTLEGPEGRRLLHTPQPFSALAQCFLHCLGMRPVCVPQGPPLWSQLRGYWLSLVSWWSQPGSAHSVRNSCSAMPSSDPFFGNVWEQPALGAPARRLASGSGLSEGDCRPLSTVFTCVNDKSMAKHWWSMTANKRRVEHKMFFLIPWSQR